MGHRHHEMPFFLSPFLPIPPCPDHTGGLPARLVIAPDPHFSKTKPKKTPFIREKIIRAVIFRSNGPILPANSF